jgi:methionyl-tRNA synthetase
MTNVDKLTFYVTTAIPYVNASPHLGFALEAVQADVIARHQRLLGKKVWFLTGTDENALKNVQAAEKEGLSVQALVDKYSTQYRRLTKALNLSNDDFIRTTEKRHFRGAQKFWQTCRREDIYKKSYRGRYCLGCEMFITEKDLVDGRCPEHLTEPELVEEENYFFRLSRYQTQLLSLIESDRLRIIPAARRNEVLSFIKRGLEDISISRGAERVKGWGIPVPGDPSQIQYVWFDALLNYITALDFASKGARFQTYWPADVHVIGKGISRFHAVYWPAFLLSAGLPLPKTIFVHGYITVGGEKISKSLGNVVDPFALVEKYGTDAVRYYLLAKIPAARDGDFTLAHFEQVYNGELANGLGNLVQRVARLCQQSNLEFPGKPPAFTDLDEPLFFKGLDAFRFNDSLQIIGRDLKELDQYLDRHHPWTLAGQKTDELSRVLGHLVARIREISVKLSPFLPETAEKIRNQFSKRKISPRPPLFPRIV